MFGSHLSVAGGLYKALLSAEKLALDTVQVFTANPRGFNVQPAGGRWVGAPLDPAAVESFRTHAARLGYKKIVAHDSYLINLASKDDALWEKSVAAFAQEMRRCDDLGITHLVTHPGAHCGTGEACGIDRVIAGMNRILRDQPDGRVTVCLETTAGQGTCLGCSFDQLAAMLAGMDAAGGKTRVAVCVDTCHILAAGYDITSAAGMRRTLDELNDKIGLARVHVWHLNDSKKPVGSRVDRHEHIGRGCVGLPAFQVICQDDHCRDVPKILETAKEKAPDGRDWDEVNLELLRGFAKGKVMTIKEFNTPAEPIKPKKKAPSRKKPGK
jgi:deoxyribonuclease-4